MKVPITLQYFDGCPNWMHAETDLKTAIEILGLDVEINYQRVESHTEAERLTFRGSPTILISGEDPFADSDAPVGLSCRVYRTGGKASGSPGVEALLEAIRATAAV
jgi:hypothetical protein